MKYFVILFVLFAIPATAAETIVFEWLPNPVEEQITGYHLYQDCGSPECIIATIPAGVTTYSMPPPLVNTSFSLTAYKVDAEGNEDESLHSDYAIYAKDRTKPGKPGGMKLKVIR